MPRLDVRVKIQLPARAVYEEAETPIMIKELSLSGALIDGLHHELKGVITIKPKLPGYKEVDLMGDVVRKFNGISVIKFYHSNRYAKARLWKYIKKQLSTTDECPYCSNVNSYGLKHCESCSRLLDFNDGEYLDKHDRETFAAKLLNRAGCLNFDQMQRVINLMDAELLGERGLFPNEEYAYASKYIHTVFPAKKGVDIPDISSVHAIENELRRRYRFESILSRHPGVIEILKLIAKIADTAATVLILGESGTGKELIARALHCNSRRKDNPFVPINCGALPENLLETEMFGHVQGAFTGAIKDKAGWFERSNEGTIFLDEVGEMPPALQVRLLRVLQTGEYSRVGSTEIRRCDVRILAATNKDLKELVKEGKFREDLYYRLNVLDILLPPLRDRKCDIPILIKHFLKTYGDKYGKGNLRMSMISEALLSGYGFPGNIRELKNIIQRAVLLSEGGVIEPTHLPASVNHKGLTYTHKGKNPSSFKIAKERAVEKFEREYIMDSLKTTAGNISRASRAAGINVKNFHEKMTKYGIDPHSFKKSVG